MQGSISELVPKICEANNDLSRRLQRYPTYEEIAAAIDVDASIIRIALERNRSPISLDQAITTQGCMSLQVLLLNFNPSLFLFTAIECMFIPSAMSMLQNPCTRV